MVSNFNNTGGAGFRRTYYSFQDEFGRNIGNAPTLAQNADAPAGILFGNQSFSMSIPSANVVTRPGDDSLLGAIQFPSTDVPQGQYAVSSYDAQWSAQIEGLELYDDTGFAHIGLLGAETTTLKTLSILVESVGQVDVSTQQGQIIWDYTNWLSVTATNQGRAEWSNQAAAVYNYTFLGVRGRRWFWNDLIDIADFGANSGYSSAPIPVAKRTRFHYFRENGTDVPSFTLPLLPIADKSQMFRVTTDGTTTQLTENSPPADETEFEVNTTTGVVDTGAAGAEDDILCIRYQIESLADVSP